MAVVRGRDGVVKSNTNAVAEVTDFTLNLTNEPIETTAHGDTARTRIAGLADANGSVTCHYDVADTNGQESLTAGSDVTLVLFPNGDTATTKQYTVPAIITDVAINSPENNSLAQRTITFVASAAVTVSTITSG